MNLRLALMLLALLGMGGVVAGPVIRNYHNPNYLRPFDYMQYWSAGRAALHQENPYSGTVLYRWQQEIGTTYADPVMMWNPPWVLPGMMALGSLDWRTGQILWFVLNFLSVVGSVLLLRDLGFARNLNTPTVLLISLFYAPTIFLLLLGQISGLLLLGVTGTIWLLEHRRPWWAGVPLMLTAIKPHLLVPFALVLALEALRKRDARKAILSGLFGLVLMGLLTWAMVPEAWQQYREATGAGQSTSHYTLHDWIHPTLGYALRQITPGQPFAAMFIPLMLAIPGVIIYSKTRAVTWTWVDQLPGLILISLIAAPYGCWAFDLVLLLVVILRVVSRVWDEQNIVIIYIVMSILTIFNLITLISLKNEHSMTNVFLLPVTCLLYIFTELRAGFRDRPQVVLP